MISRQRPPALALHVPTFMRAPLAASARLAASLAVCLEDSGSASWPRKWHGCTGGVRDRCKPTGPVLGKAVREPGRTERRTPGGPTRCGETEALGIGTSSVRLLCTAY